MKNNISKFNKILSSILVKLESDEIKKDNLENEKLMTEILLKLVNIVSRITKLNQNHTEEGLINKEKDMEIIQLFLSKNSK
jgi:hypothetical protein